MKLAGIIFIVVSAGSVGLRISSNLRKRCRLLRQLLSALQVMENEVGFCSTPLPQTFALMAVRTDEALSRVFSSVAKTMDKRRWISPRAAMEQALQEEPLLGGDKQLAEELLALTSGLGKYDRESQLKTLNRSQKQVAYLIQTAEQECSVRSKTYEVLGLCVGISVAILLI